MTSPTGPIGPTGPADAPEMPRMGRLGPYFAALWLFFLVEPVIEGFRLDDHLRGLGGVATTVVFAGLYMSIWLRARAEANHGRGFTPPRLPAALGYVLGLSALGALMMVLLGEAGIASVVYVAVACVMVFGFRVAAPLVVALCVCALTLAAVPGWGSQVGTAFGVMAASVAVFGVRTVIARNAELVEAHQANAELAVDNERSRFARDLHDILGHSLTVITVKAELANRLLDTDPDRARSELADLERLSRDALADVRRAVEGYREMTLPGELARARQALTAAEIEAQVPGSTDDIPTDLRDLFAWTVREGVTNVIRHSRARRCEVRLTPERAEVRDDGVGPGEEVPGSGLNGLRERAAAVGATVVTRSLEPGYSLAVVRR